MKKGIYSWFGYPLPFAERIKLIKEAGFDSVMLWWGDDRNDLDGSKYDHPKIVKDHGLTIENVHLPFNGIGVLWKDDEEATKREQVIIDQINEIGKYDVDTVVMHITNGSKLPSLSSVMIDRILRINEVAKANGIRLALENLKVVEALDYLLANIKDPNVGFCYDSGHHHCYCSDQDLLKRYQDRLFAIHLHDNFGDSDMHMLPYDGSVDWNYVKSGIDASIYDRSLTLELEGSKHPGYHELSAQEFLALAYQKLIQLDK